MPVVGVQINTLILHTLIQSRDLTQSELSTAMHELHPDKKLGVTDRQIRRWLSGEDKPSRDHLDHLCEVLGVNSNYIELTVTQQSERNQTMRVTRWNTLEELGLHAPPDYREILELTDRLKQSNPDGEVSEGGVREADFDPPSEADASEDSE